MRTIGKAMPAISSFRRTVKSFLPHIVTDALAARREASILRKLAPLSAANAALADSETGRCFIVGSGPSIRGIDLCRLAGRHVIGLNNLVAHPDFATVAPRHHLIAPIHPPQTQDQWLAWLRMLDQRIPEGAHFWAGTGGQAMSAPTLITQHGLLHHALVHPFAVAERVNGTITDRLRFDRPVLPAQTASIYGIGLALWLGYREIVTLGLDHNYFTFTSERDMRFYSSAPHQKGERAIEPRSQAYADEFIAMGRIFTIYRELDAAAQALGAVIANATDTSVNRMFLPISFDQALAPEPLPETRPLASK